MFLIVFREYKEQSAATLFGFSQSTIFQMVLFVGFAHIWKGVLMKQLKYRELKERSDVLVIVAGILLSLILEVLRWRLGLSEQFNFVNAGMNIVGVFVGLGMFRLVYR
jgi:hypothetical protein